MVPPARKKSSAKTISCLRNCLRCRQARDSLEPRSHLPGAARDVAKSSATWLQAWTEAMRRAGTGSAPLRMRLGLLEAPGEGEGKPGLAAPGEQPPGGDMAPLGLPPVQDEQEGRRVGGDVDVGPG